MTVIDITCVIFGILGVVSSVWWYWELRKWARQCQQGRIAIAYKRKVVGTWPIQDFIIWCNQLDQDKDSNGRVIFSRAGVSIALVKKPPRKVSRRKVSTPQSRQGTWAASQNKQERTVSREGTSDSVAR
jgi:hypothetical protein